MYYKNGIIRTRNQIRDRIGDLQIELESLPDGELFIYTRDSKAHYYKRLPKVGNRKKERRIGIKKDPDTLNALVRKKYITSALVLLNKNAELLEELINHFSPADENSVMVDFTEKYPELSKAVYSGEKKDIIWQGAGAEAEDATYHPENLKSTASDGSRRRSVGELLIGTKLDHYNIPYRYEVRAHPDLPYMPDFTIKRPRDGKVIYWEHFGMVNDDEYMEGNRKKLIEYESVGIVPWENLIITYNQRDGGINEKLIDAMIHGWLL